MEILKLENVSKFYKSAETVSVGMKNVSVSFNIGEFVAITGESGSGKSTLLNVISGLDGYEEGELFHYGEETSHYTISDWETYRSAYIGFVFQNYNIIDSYTVYQNVMFALEIQGYKKEDRKKRALELIERVGLTSHKNHKASKLSGGQKQRAVLARALAKDTPVIVADEPTGNLDSESAKQVMALLHELSKDKLVIVVTHDYSQVEEYATRKIKMHDGTIAEDLNLKEYEKQTEPVKLEAKKVSFMTLLKISLRNIFSTPKRTIFMLILQVLVIGLFTIMYSSQVKTNRESGLLSSYVYPSVPETRLLVERRDGQAFTNDELNRFKNNRNTLAVYKNAHLFYNENDLEFSVGNGEYYFNISKTDSAVVLNKRDVRGSLPVLKNEVVISSFYEYVDIGDVIKLKFRDYSYNNEPFYLEEFKVVGIDKLERDTIYFSESYLNQEVTGPNNEKVYEMIKDTLIYNMGVNINYYYFKVVYDENISLNYDVQVKKEKPSEVHTVYEKDHLTFYSNYGNSNIGINVPLISIGIIENPALPETQRIVYVTEEIYNNLINEYLVMFEDLYSLSRNIISVEVKGYKQGDNFIASINQDVYKVYYPANISSPMRDVILFIQVLMSSILLIFVGMFLFSIVHAVSKNVMRARKKDFAIFRSIGTNQKTLAQMVVLEQVLTNMFGFVVTIIGLTVLGNYFGFINTALPYMKVIDYFMLALIFLFLGVWLGLRFNKKIFNQSVIEVLTLSKGEF